MKKIVYPILLLVLTACKGNQQTTNNEFAAIPVAETIADTIAQPEVDAITSATSKPNQVSFNGRIVLPPQRQATIALTMGGIVKKASLLPGQWVAANSVIATLENPEFITLQQTYLDSHAQTEYLLAEYERQKNLSAEQAASQKKFQQSKADFLSMKSRQDAAAAQLSLLGVQTEALLKNGKDLADIQVGSPVQFRVNGMGTQTFHGIVISIGQKVDETNRSLEVYASIKEENVQFRPGMYVTAHIQK